MGRSRRRGRHIERKTAAVNDGIYKRVFHDVERRRGLKYKLKGTSINYSLCHCEPRRGAAIPHKHLIYGDCFVAGRSLQ